MVGENFRVYYNTPKKFLDDVRVTRKNSKNEEAELTPPHGVFDKTWSSSRVNTHTHTHTTTTKRAPFSLFNISGDWANEANVSWPVSMAISGTRLDVRGYTAVCSGVCSRRFNFFPFSFYLLLHFSNSKTFNTFLLLLFFCCRLFKRKLFWSENKERRKQKQNIHPASPSQQIFPGYRNSQRRI